MASSGGESGDIGRLLWLPDPLLRSMLDIGVIALCFVDRSRAEKLEKMITAIPQVR